MRRGLVAACLAASLCAAPAQAMAAPATLRSSTFVLDLWAPAHQLAGAAGPFRLGVGDVFGEGRDALVVLSPDGESTTHRLSVFRSGPSGPEPAAAVTGLEFRAGGVTVADVTGNGRAEVWLGHAPKVGCLEWSGQEFRPLEPWKFWQNKPVVLARVPGDGAPDQVLALGGYYSEEVAVGLITAWWRDKMWGKSRDLRASAFYHPDDRLAVADVTGDGRQELLVAASLARRVLPVQPFTVEEADREQTLAVFGGVYPVAVAVADLDADGTAEVYLAENRPGPGGAPAGVVRAFRWSGSGFVEVISLPVGDAVSDLAAGDWDGDRRSDLIVAKVRPGESGVQLALQILSGG